MNVFKEIKSKLSLVDIVRRKVRLKVKNNYWIGLCPFHQEKTPSFLVSDIRKNYYCFGCHASGDVFNFVQNAYNYNKQEVLQYLAQLANVKLKNYDKQETQKQEYHRLLSVIHQYFRVQLMKSLKAKQYLEKRDLHLQICDKLKLGYAPAGANMCIQYLRDQGFTGDQILKSGLVTAQSTANNLKFLFYNRIMFPIFDQHDQIVGFGGRDISDQSTIKYINSADNTYFKKGNLLYNFSMAKQSPPQDKLLVVEGYTDVATLVQCGMDRCVAVLGTAMGVTHLKLLWQIDNTPYICFDGDPAGQKAMFLLLEKALEILQYDKSLAFICLPDHEDPDTVIRTSGKEVFMTQLHNSISLLHALKLYIIDRSKSVNIPIQTLYYQKQIRQIMNLIQDETVREYYTKKLTEMFISPVSFKQYTHMTAESTMDVIRREEALILAFLLYHPQIYQKYEYNILNLKFNTVFLNIIFQSLIEVWEEMIYSERSSEDLLAYLSHLFEDQQMENIVCKKSYAWLLSITTLDFRRNNLWTVWHWNKNQHDIMKHWQKLQSRPKSQKYSVNIQSKL